MKDFLYNRPFFPIANVNRLSGRVDDCRKSKLFGAQSRYNRNGSKTWRITSFEYPVCTKGSSLPETIRRDWIIPPTIIIHFITTYIWSVINRSRESWNPNEIAKLLFPRNCCCNRNPSQYNIVQCFIKLVSCNKSLLECIIIICSFDAYCTRCGFVHYKILPKNVRASIKMVYNSH